MWSISTDCSKRSTAVRRFSTGQTRNRRAARVARLLSCALLLLLLAGCGADTTRVYLHSGLGQDEIFRVGTLICTRQEMSVYLLNASNQYERSLGGLTFKNAPAGRETVTDMLRESTLALASQIKAMRLLADSMGVTYEAGDEEKAAAAAGAYFASLTEEDRRVLKGVTQEVIRGMYLDVALANRVYAHTIRDVNPEISDDEARTITVEQIRIDKANDAEAARLKAQEALARIADGEDFANVLPDYNEAEADRVSFGTGMSEDIPEEAAFALETGEVSPLLETPDAFYILRCVSSFDRELTRANKALIVEQRRHEAFGLVYDEFIETLPVQLNEKAWESLVIPEDAGADTVDFWRYYDQFFADS